MGYDTTFEGEFDLTPALSEAQIKYLNNIIEQDHRAVKRVTRPMLGLKSFRAAQAVLHDIELTHIIRKAQFNMADCDCMSSADQLYALAGRVRTQ